MAKSKAGGGINSNKLVHPGVRTGDLRKGKNPRAVSQIGSSIGNHSTENRRTLTKAVEKMAGPRGISVPLGNEIATNVKGGGPGAGRVLYGQSGTNQVYGSVAGNPKPQGRDILSEFGPDVGGRRR